MLTWLMKAFGKGWNNPEIEDELTWEWLFNDGIKRGDNHGCGCHD